MTTALIDTSAVLALADSRDPRHRAVSEGLASHVGVIRLPDATIFEAAQLTLTRRGARAEAALVRRLVESMWRRESPTDVDLARAADLIDQYADARLGLVDASLVAMAERLGATRIYTLDRRDLALVRPRHVEAFEILP